MSPFEFDNYKKYIVTRIEQMPKGGRGEFKRIAEKLHMHTTMVSQIFSGSKDLNLEQACLLCDYLGLTAFETDYFLALVQLSRAGTPRLKLQIQRQITALKKQSKQIVNRIPQDAALSEETKATFYSNWYYSGIRLLTSIEGYQDIDSISEYFELPKARVRQVLDFLLAHKLCVEKNGKFEMGPQLTHIDGESPLVQRHHFNWRIKAMQHYEKLNASEMAFSAPLSISEKDFAAVRELLVQFVKNLSDIVKDSDAEKVACLNLDWFEVK